MTDTSKQPPLPPIVIDDDDDAGYEHHYEHLLCQHPGGNCTQPSFKHCSLQWCERHYTELLAQQFGNNTPSHPNAGFISKQRVVVALKDAIELHSDDESSQPLPPAKPASKHSHQKKKKKLLAVESDDSDDEHDHSQCSSDDHHHDQHDRMHVDDSDGGISVDEYGASSSKPRAKRAKKQSKSTSSKYSDDEQHIKSSAKANSSKKPAGKRKNMSNAAHIPPTSSAKHTKKAAAASSKPLPSSTTAAPVLAPPGTQIFGLSYIAQYLEPMDLVSLASTSKGMKQFVTNDAAWHNAQCFVALRKQLPGLLAKHVADVSQLPNPDRHTSNIATLMIRRSRNEKWQLIGIKADGSNLRAILIQLPTALAVLHTPKDEEWFADAYASVRGLKAKYKRTRHNAVLIVDANSKKHKRNKQAQYEDVHSHHSHQSVKQCMALINGVTQLLPVTTDITVYGTFAREICWMLFDPPQGYDTEVHPCILWLNEDGEAVFSNPRFGRDVWLSMIHQRGLTLISDVSLLDTIRADQNSQVLHVMCYSDPTNPHDAWVSPAAIYKRAELAQQQQAADASYQSTTGCGVCAREAVSADEWQVMIDKRSMTLLSDLAVLQHLHTNDAEKKLHLRCNNPRHKGDDATRNVWMSPKQLYNWKNLQRQHLAANKQYQILQGCSPCVHADASAKWESSVEGVLSATQQKVSHRPSEQQVRCPKCGKLITRRPALVGHMFTSHRTEYPSKPIANDVLKGLPRDRPEYADAQTQQCYCVINTGKCCAVLIDIDDLAALRKHMRSKAHKGMDIPEWLYGKVEDRTPEQQAEFDKYFRRTTDEDDADIDRKGGAIDENVTYPHGHWCDPESYNVSPVAEQADDAAPDNEAEDDSAEDME